MAEEQFIAITGADAATARQYVESCGGDLTAAVNAFFGGGGGAAPAAAAAAPPAQVQAAPAKSPQKKKPRSRIAGFGSLAQEEEQEEGKGRKTNEYYTGGHSSGMAVIGRPEDGDQVAERLVAGAKASGAQVDEHQVAEQAKWAAGGYQLGSNQRVEAAAAPVQDVVRIIKMFKNGFTIDDGPLRGFAENREFIDAIAQGHVPAELEQEARARGAQLKVDLVDNRTKEYEAPAQAKPKVQSFTGSGHSLGGSSTAAAPVVVASVAAADVVLDESQPVTTLQLRLPDGSRVKAKFNHSHTLADVRAYLAKEKPALSANYTLMSTFPRKSFASAENSMTLEAAGVLGAALLVKLN